MRPSSLVTHDDYDVQQRTVLVPWNIVICTNAWQLLLVARLPVEPVEAVEASSTMVR